MLRFMGSQRVGQDSATELNTLEKKEKPQISNCSSLLKNLERTR